MAIPLSFWTYPWDFWDEGPAAFDLIRELGVDQVRMAVSYHRALAITPRSRQGRMRLLPDGIYFASDPKYYADTPLKPLPVDHPPGGVAPLMEGARAAGLSVTAWVVLLNNWTLGERHPQIAVRNAWGDLLPHSLCPAQPAVIRYATGLVREVVDRLPVDALELEGWHYYTIPHIALRTKSAYAPESVEIEQASLCFCPACLARARQTGLDGEAVAAAVRSGQATGLPELLGYQQMRVQVVTDLVAALREAAGTVPVRLFSVPVSAAPALGIAYEQVSALVDGMITACYLTEPAQVKAEALAARRAVGPQKPLDIALKLAEPGVPERLSELVAATAEAAPASISLYHYGMSTAAGLGAVRHLSQQMRRA